MNRIHALFLLIIPFFGFRSDCNADFDFKSQKTSNNEFSIELVLKRGASQEYKIELYDLYTDELVAKKSINFVAGQSKIVFEKIKPSSYTIMYTSSDCINKKSIRGKGIVLY